MTAPSMTDPVTLQVHARRSGWWRDLIALLPLIRQERASFALATLGGVFSQAGALCAWALTAWAIGRVVLGFNLDEQTGLVAGAGTAILVVAGGRWMQSHFSHDFAFRLIETLQIGLYDGLDRAAPARLMGRRTGDLASVVTADALMMEWFFAHMLADYIGAALVPLGALIILSLVDPVLSWTLLPFLLVAASVPFWLAKSAGEQGQKLRDAMATLHAEIVEGLQGVRDIASFNYEAAYLTKLDRLGNRFGALQRRYGSRAGLERAAIDVTLAATVLMMLWMTSIRAGDGAIPLAMVPLLIVLARGALVPIMEVSHTARRLGELRASAERIMNVLHQEPAVSDVGRRRLPATTSAPIRFEEVGFGYGPDHMLLKQLSFEVGVGETVALVGGSGTGKTTCAHLLMRFWDVSSGAIRIGDLDIRSVGLASLRRHIALIPQDAYLFDLTIADNIALGVRKPSRARIEAAAEQAGAGEFIAALPDGYDTRCGEGGARLSGGQRQRIAAARALLRGAHVLIMDEAVSNLDAAAEESLNQRMRADRAGKTTIIIAHRLSTIRHADRIIVLDRGQIVEAGRHEELLRREGAYFRLMASAKDGILP